MHCSGLEDKQCKGQGCFSCFPQPFPAPPWPGISLCDREGAPPNSLASCEFTVAKGMHQRCCS